MNKLFKTFWLDNRKILAILSIVITAVTFVFPIIILLVTSRVSQNTYSYTTSGDTYSGILIVLFFISIFLIFSLFTFGSSIFIAIRTLTSTAKTRYAIITASKFSRATFGFIIYLIACIVALTLTIFSFSIISLILVAMYPGTEFIFATLFDSWEDASLVLSMISLKGSFFSYLVTSLISPYLFWQLIFVLPQTKLLRSISKTGVVFSVILFFITTSILQFSLNLWFVMSSTYGAHVNPLHFISFLTPTIYLITYVYAYMKELEL